MSMPDHECEAEEVCDGIIVTLHFDAILPLCPQQDERRLRHLIQHHAEAIAAHMVSAGLEAAALLCSGKGEPS